MEAAERDDMSILLCNSHALINCYGGGGVRLWHNDTQRLSLFARAASTAIDLGP